MDGRNPSRFSETSSPNRIRGLRVYGLRSWSIAAQESRHWKDGRTFWGPGKFVWSTSFQVPNEIFVAGGGGWTRKGELCHVNDSFFCCNKKLYEMHFHGGCFPLQHWFCFVKPSYKCEGGGLDRLEDRKSPFPEKRNSTVQQKSNWAMKKPLVV